jgi:hypothetical protein
MAVDETGFRSLNTITRRKRRRKLIYLFIVYLMKMSVTEVGVGIAQSV